VAEEKEAGDTIAQASGAAADPAALSLALSGADRETASAFLRKQERLSDLQIARLEA
jgi:Flp pilus assembly protein TadD